MNGAQAKKKNWSPFHPFPHAHIGACPGTTLGVFLLCAGRPSRSWVAQGPTRTAAREPGCSAVVAQAEDRRRSRTGTWPATGSFRGDGLKSDEPIRPRGCCQVWQTNRRLARKHNKGGPSALDRGTPGSTRRRLVDNTCAAGKKNCPGSAARRVENKY